MNMQLDYTINVRGKLLSLKQPQVMGILNCTPDSFYAGSRKQTEKEIIDRANQIIAEGGSIIDIGAYSTRPGAAEVSEEEEMKRLRFALSLVRKEHPDSIISIDTYRAKVAQMSVEEYGADIINDVSEGGLTGIVDTPLEQTDDVYPEIFRMMGQLKVPYILMSVQGNLHDMIKNFSKEVQQLRDLSVKDIILDPGFGFGKDIQANYDILSDMDELRCFELPILVGVSRKRMIHQLLDISVDEALNGTTIVNTISLMKGANILRVHDVKEAVQAVKIVEQLSK
ncbi:dihydropteroate synthase [Segatella albensis]|jgi:dihydropteroate synthase|uniref:dihydropteroate synthase n=1 Tax=Segatella albensis TaxID=77768 RepID=UPI000469B6C7|nr:dihydropteroate synthase [Segatella albensis]